MRVELTEGRWRWRQGWEKWGQGWGRWRRRWGRWGQRWGRWRRRWGRRGVRGWWGGSLLAGWQALVWLIAKKCAPTIHTCIFVFCIFFTIFVFCICMLCILNFELVLWNIATTLSVIQVHICILHFSLLSVNVPIIYRGVLPKWRPLLIASDHNHLRFLAAIAIWYLQVGWWTSSRDPVCGCVFLILFVFMYLYLSILYLHL